MRPDEDLWVKNPAHTAIVDLTPGLDRVNNVNLRGVWACMKYGLLQMPAQGGDTVC